MLTEKKRDFIAFMLSAEVLRFGNFVTKSGRNTQYFVNTGNYKTVNEKVNGTLAIYWKWWDITKFTHRIMY